MTMRMLLCVLVVGLCASTALALDPMGPPKANLQKGSWSVGAEYSYSDMTIARKPASWSDAQRTTDGTIHKAYLNIGYGLSDNVVGFVRLGVGIADFDRTAEPHGYWAKWEGDGDMDLIWGGGFKATLAEDETVAWGFIAQLSNAAYSGDAVSTHDGEKAGYKVDMYEIQLAVGPTVKLADGFHVYGGPFVHLVSGEYKDIRDDDDQLYKPIEEQDTCLGGYIGTLVKVAENVDLNVEYQLTGDAWAAAAGVTFRFN